MAKENIDLRDYLLSLSNHIKLIYERLEKSEARIDNISAEINGIKDSSLIKMDLNLPPIPSTPIEKPSEEADGFWDRRKKKREGKKIEEEEKKELEKALLELKRSLSDYEKVYPQQKGRDN